MAAAQGGLPLGRIGALLAIVGMTALPFVSCGPITIDGHEFLRNKTPDTGELGEELGGALKLDELGGDTPEGAPAQPAPSMGLSKQKEQMFEGDDLWLWFVYLGLLGLAAIGLLFPDGVRAAIAFGAIGAGGVVFFVNRFENMVFRDSKEAMALGGGFDWEIGAFLALGGFVLIAIGGLRQTAGPPD